MQINSVKIDDNNDHMYQLCFQPRERRIEKRKKDNSSNMSTFNAG